MAIRGRPHILKTSRGAPALFGRIRPGNLTRRCRLARQIEWQVLKGLVQGLQCLAGGWTGAKELRVYKLLLKEREPRSYQEYMVMAVQGHFRYVFWSYEACPAVDGNPLPSGGVGIWSTSIDRVSSIPTVPGVDIVIIHTINHSCH